MFLVEKIKNHTLLPVLIVLLVLSLESIIVVFLEFFELNLKLIDSNLLPYSDEFLDLVVLTFAKGFALLILLVLMSQKLKSGGYKVSYEARLRCIIGTIFLYVGCIFFLLENLNNSLLIYVERAPIIKVWPEIILSRMSIDYLGYQLFLIVLLLVAIPVFEELLYRKAIIQALLMKQIKIGWIIVISPLIYAISPFISNLVIYTDEQAIWDIVIRIISGLILAIIYIKTQKVKYPILLRSLVNCVIYIQSLTMFHTIFSPFRELYSVLILILTSIGIILFFFLLFDGIATFWSTSSVPPWLNSLLDFRFPENALKTLLFTIFIFLPLLPFGLNVFIDHTILFGDFGGILIKTLIKSIFLGFIIFICGILIQTNHELYEVSSETNTSLMLFFQRIYRHVLDNLTPRVVLRNLGVIILVIGVLSPILFISMEATIFTSVPLLGRLIDINMQMASGQTPILSFSQIKMTSRSSFFWMIPIQKTEDTVFYFLKHTNGAWYFLPDTFMSHPGDWLYGLITVGAWFLFLIILCFTIYEYINQRKIVAGISSIALIVIEVVWYLFTFGLGSIPAEAEPPTPSANQTLSDLIQMDFEINSFLFLPLGLILLLLAAIIILISGIRNYRQEKKNVEHVIFESEESEDLKNFNGVSSTEDDSIIEELEKKGDKQ